MVEEGSVFHLVKMSQQCPAEHAALPSRVLLLLAAGLVVKDLSAVVSAVAAIQRVRDEDLPAVAAGVDAVLRFGLGSAVGRHAHVSVPRACLLVRMVPIPQNETLTAMTIAGGRMYVLSPKGLLVQRQYGDSGHGVQWRHGDVFAGRTRAQSLASVDGLLCALLSSGDASDGAMTLGGTAAAAAGAGGDVVPVAVSAIRPSADTPGRRPSTSVAAAAGGASAAAGGGRGVGAVLVATAAPPAGGVASPAPPVQLAVFDDCLNACLAVITVDLECTIDGVLFKPQASKQPVLLAHGERLYFAFVAVGNRTPAEALILASVDAAAVRAAVDGAADSAGARHLRCTQSVELKEGPVSPTSSALWFTNGSVAVCIPDTTAPRSRHVAGHPRHFSVRSGEPLYPTVQPLAETAGIVSLCYDSDSNTVWGLHPARRLAFQWCSRGPRYTCVLCAAR